MRLSGRPLNLIQSVFLSWLLAVVARAEIAELSGPL